MTIQELNLIVTVKRSNEILFQISPMLKEELEKIEGLRSGKLLEESSSDMKCKKCNEQVVVNLFWTKSVVIGRKSNVNQQKTRKGKSRVVKEPPPPLPEIVEVKTEILDEEEAPRVKEEPIIQPPVEVEQKIDENDDDFVFEDENVQKLESESDDDWFLPEPEVKVEKEAPKIEEKDVKVKPRGRRRTKNPKEKRPRGRPKAHPTFILCHICSKNIKGNLFTEHMFKHNISDRPYQCDHCDKSFSRLASLRDHLIVRHFTSLAEFLCPHCPSVFSREPHLKKHLYDRHRIGKSQKQTCPHCNMQLSNKGILKSHILNIHTDPALKKRWQCEECSKIFFKKSHYDSHMRTHLPEDQRPFRCEICGKTYIHNNVFKRHLMEHENFESILTKCEVCHKGFKYANSLKVHMRIHTGETPYECKFCQRKFGDRSNHRSHMKQHESQMGIKLTLNFEERRLVYHKVLDKKQLIEDN